MGIDTFVDIYSFLAAGRCPPQTAASEEDDDDVANGSMTDVPFSVGVDSAKCMYYCIKIHKNDELPEMLQMFCNIMERFGNKSVRLHENDHLYL